MYIMLNILFPYVDNRRVVNYKYQFVCVRNPCFIDDDQTYGVRERLEVAHEATAVVLNPGGI